MSELERALSEPVGRVTGGEWTASPYWATSGWVLGHCWRVVTDTGYVVADGMSRADAEFVAGAHAALKNTADEIVAWVEGLA